MSNNKQLTMIDFFVADCRQILKDNNYPNSIIITDPPFNIGYKYNSYKDNMAKDDYYNMLLEVLKPPFVLIHYPESIYEFCNRGGGST